MTDTTEDSETFYLTEWQRDGYFCPEHERGTEWKYFDNNVGLWSYDKTIKLECGKNVTTVNYQI